MMMTTKVPSHMNSNGMKNGNMQPQKKVKKMMKGSVCAMTGINQMQTGDPQAQIQAPQAAMVGGSQKIPVPQMAMAMNQGPNFARAVTQEISQINPTYANARYAPTGNEQVGKPFLNFREFGGRMTQFQPTALSMTGLTKQMNLPTNNTLFRNGVENDAIGIGNRSLQDWTASTQTLSNISFDTLFCTSDADCSAYGPNFTCNSNRDPDRFGLNLVTGSVCQFTQYPELFGGKYTRKLVNEGGIGQACNTDADCGEGYECNNEVNPQLSNIQQLGYCAQPYFCYDKGQSSKFYVGYPYNSGIPIVPPEDQNNGGVGYDTKAECEDHKVPLQHCVRGPGNKYFATYPGYCPIPSQLRQQTPQGALVTSTPQEKAQGFTIPAYGNNLASSKGGSGGQEALFTGFNINSNLSQKASMQEPLMFSLALNPNPPNM